MKVKRSSPQDAQKERYITTALIVSDDVCRALAPLYREEYFQTKITKEVIRWCLDFLQEYNTAPKKEIQTIFEVKTKAGKIDPETEKQIEKFLDSISREYEELENFNVQFYIDMGKKYFKKRSYVNLSDDIKDSAEREDLEKAEKAYTNFSSVQEKLDDSRIITSPVGINKFYESTKNQSSVLFTMPGDLGKLIGPIERDTFIGLMGREKIGKTMSLMMFAWQAAKAGLHVAMIEVGDMSHDQLDRRFASCMTQMQPTFSENTDEEIFVPILDCYWNQTGKCDKVNSEALIDPKTHTFLDNPLTDEEFFNSHIPCTECKRTKDFSGSIWWEKKKIGTWMLADLENATSRFSKKFKGSITTEAFPTKSVTANKIRDWFINKQKNEGKFYSVGIIDYPDILLPDDERKLYRHQENEKWEIMRKISQEFHNCIIVATQADADSYDMETITPKNFSEDKRKYGHTTHFYGLNKTWAEEEMGIIRFSPLFIRERGLQRGKTVSVLQSLINKRVYISSFFGKAPHIKDYEKKRK